MGRAVITTDECRVVHVESGRALSWGVLAKHYGFTDLDGSQPEAGRFLTDAYFGDDKDAKAEGYR
ncbi:MAG TPA: hypothetical protein VGC06_21900 [Actinomycetes bacterium]